MVKISINFKDGVKKETAIRLLKKMGLSLEYEDYEIFKMAEVQIE